MYHICFVRDDAIVGYLGYEGAAQDEVLQSKKEYALTLHDLKAASKRARSFLDEALPTSMKSAQPRERVMLDFCSGNLTVDIENNRIIMQLGEKHQIRVVSVTTGKAVETYVYEPR